MPVAVPARPCVHCRLDNGCTGFIHIKNLSDKKVTDPMERVKVGIPSAYSTDLCEGRIRYTLTY